MANLVISTVCNRDCPYCFTRDHRDNSAARNFLEVSSFIGRLDFLDRSQIDQARLLGGEPTLHPQFAELVKLARERGKKLTVFSNGLMPETALSCLENLAATECTVMINVGEPSDIGETVHRQQLATIRRLGERVLLGFNIYRSNFRLDFLLPIIFETNCKPAIRLGIAHPCLSGTNQYVHPNQYRVIGERIAHFAPFAADAGVALDFDCGFVRCMFSEEEMERLTKAGANLGWRCNPILDIGIEDQVIHCYPLASFLSLPLTEDIDASALRAVFETPTQPYRMAGIFKECSICSFKKTGGCTGGCLSTTMRRFRSSRFSLRIPYGKVAA
jgi:hypothetical protein